MTLSIVSAEILMKMGLKMEAVAYRAWKMNTKIRMGNLCAFHACQVHTQTDPVSSLAMHVAQESFVPVRQIVTSNHIFVNGLRSMEIW